MSVRWRRIQAMTNKLLLDNEVVAPPIPVSRIAKSVGIKLIYQTYDQADISGFLCKSRGGVVIGVNKNHHRNRIRFTIAHELGHHFLHDYGYGNIHLDYAFRVMLRDDESSQGTNVEEVEANAFAAELLMPPRFLSSDLTAIGALDIEDDQSLKKLAERYQVSPLAMHFRLARLGHVVI